MGSGRKVCKEKTQRATLLSTPNKKNPKSNLTQCYKLKKPQRATFLCAPNKTTIGVSHHTKLWNMIRKLFNPTDKLAIF